MKPTRLFRLFLLVAGLLACGTLLRAEDLNGVKARMEQRLGSVDALKHRGSAGENNRGFLEARGNPSGEDQKIISDENADRRVVYAAIAAQTGATAEAVGRQRASQLAVRAARGVWVQEASGEWRQKG